MALSVVLWSVGSVLHAQLCYKVCRKGKGLGAQVCVQDSVGTDQGWWAWPSKSKSV